MKILIPFLLLSVSLLGQDTPAEPAARALITSDFVASLEPLGTRAAQTQLTVVYLDTAADDQFVDVATLRADVTALIRQTTASLTPEAFAKAIARGLGEKYPQIVGMTVSIFLNAQTISQQSISLTRTAPDLTAAVKASVEEKLAQSAASREKTQSRIVR